MLCGGSGNRTDLPGLTSDLNLLWEINNRPPVHRVSGRGSATLSMQEILGMGYELHSLVADPRCTDLASRNFRLQDDSPALTLGFRPIDVSDVGPRPSDSR